MECKVNCGECENGKNYFTKNTCHRCDGTSRVEGCDERRKIMEAFPHLTEKDFHRHETDLYVLDPDGKIRQWLKTNYEFYCNVQGFIGEGEWKGKRCLDIPFAAFGEKYPKLGKVDA